MGYDREIIRDQLECRSAEQLAALLVEWADDQVMTNLINEALELYHGITPHNHCRPGPKQLEALGFPKTHQYSQKQIGYYQATDREESQATRMILWWVSSNQYQLRRRPGPQVQWSTVHGAWSTEEDFTGVFNRFYS